MSKSRPQKEAAAANETPEFELAEGPAIEPEAAGLEDAPQTGSAEAAAAAEPEGVERPEIVEVGLSVPLNSPPGPYTYVPVHVEARLKPWHATVLKRLTEALMSRAARLVERRRGPDGESIEEPGRFVQSGADSVRWMLEEVDRNEKTSNEPGG